jgi:hypothetical protein
MTLTPFTTLGMAICLLGLGLSGRKTGKPAQWKIFLIIGTLVLPIAFLLFWIELR